MAELLEVELGERRLLIYSKALEDLGSEGLERAMAQLLADPWARAGKMLLPGQIRQLVQGSVEVEADYKAMEIMRVVKSYPKAEWKRMLTTEQYGVVLCYGLQTMEEMGVGQSPTIMSQLRSLCQAQAVTRRRLRAVEHMAHHGLGNNLAVRAILESPTTTDGEEL